MTKNSTVWEEYRHRFEQTDEQLGKVVKVLVEGTDAYHRGIAKFVAQMDQQLAHGVVQFSGVVSELAEAIEEFAAAKNSARLEPSPVAGRITAAVRRT